MSGRSAFSPHDGPRRVRRPGGRGELQSLQVDQGRLCCPPTWRLGSRRHRCPCLSGRWHFCTAGIKYRASRTTYCTCDVPHTLRAYCTSAIHNLVWPTLYPYPVAPPSQNARTEIYTAVWRWQSAGSAISGGEVTRCYPAALALSNTCVARLPLFLAPLFPILASSTPKNPPSLLGRAIRSLNFLLTRAQTFCPRLGPFQLIFLLPIPIAENLPTFTYPP